jgi:nucleoside-triphosphatase
MTAKILITGPPRSGKSTLIQQIIKNLKDEFSLKGFLTPEVRKKGKRIGFDVEDINSDMTIPLARKGSYSSQYRLGSYKVFIDKFNQYLDDKLSPLIYQLDLKKNTKLILIIDEIGKMELFSELFQTILRTVFTSELCIIATIGQKMNHPIKDFILNIPSIKLFTVSHNNQQKIFREILTILKKK